MGNPVLYNTNFGADHLEVTKWERWLQISFCLLFLSLLGKGGQAIAQVPNLDSVAVAIQNAQNSILNVEIDHFAMTEDERPGDSGAWKRIPQKRTGNAWYNGLPGSQVRIQRDEIIGGDPGVMPWSESCTDTGFDGQTGRHLVSRFGPPGKLFDRLEAGIYPTRPPMLNDPLQPYADGTAFCLNFFHLDDPQNRSLGQIFADGARSGQHWPITSDTIFGIQTVKVSCESSVANFYFWFDPSKGFALRKYLVKFRKRDASWVLDRQMEIAELMEGAKGIWFPIAATCIERYVDKPGWQLRLSFHADKVVINNPTFDPQIFTVPIPAGCVVSDRVNGTIFRTSSANAISEAIDSEAKQLKSTDVPLRSEPPQPALPVASASDYSLILAILAAV